MNYSIRKALLSDLEELHQVVEKAYRGKKKGWTSEEHIINGHRIQKEDLEKLVGDNNGKLHIFVLEETVEGKKHLRGSIKIDFEEGKREAEFGMFAVDPEHQSKGFGGGLLRFAEDYARNKLGATLFNIWVIDERFFICFSSILELKSVFQ